MKIIVVEFIIKPFSVPYVRSQLLPDVYQFPFLAASRKVSIFNCERTAAVAAKKERRTIDPRAIPLSLNLIYEEIPEKSKILA
jgi:hypothetical protein